jgi:hypothetical protein
VSREHKPNSKMKKLYSVAHNWLDDQKIKEELEQAGTLPIKLKLRLQKGPADYE